MRHRVKGRRLKRTSEQKLALMRALAQALIERGAIETTEARCEGASPVRREADHEGQVGHAA